MADISMGKVSEIPQLKATEHYWSHTIPHMDYPRSVDQIAKEGSNPSGESRFKSSGYYDQQSEKDAK